MGFLKTVTNGIASSLGGGIVSGGISLLSSLFGKSSQNAAIDKQIKAQAEENQKTREYNLMLARMQNEWNQQQWERENEYNSPEKQMARFKAAGLNPDLIYGQGNNGNSAQLSGSLSSGAPATPQDMSALGQKMTLAQVTEHALNNAMKAAQINNIKADTAAKQEETRATTFENDLREFMDTLPLSEKSIDEFLNSPEFEFSPQGKLSVRQKLLELRELTQRVSGQNTDNLIKQVYYRLKSATFDDIVKSFSAKAKIDDAEARFMLETFAKRTSMIDSQDQILKNQASQESYNVENQRFTDIMNKIFKGGVTFANILESLVQTLRFIWK